MRIVPPWAMAFGIVGTLLVGVTISVHAAWLHHLRSAIILDPEVEKTRLLQTDMEFALRSREDGPAHAFWIYLADDAVQLPAGADPIFGRTAIIADMETWSKTVLTWQPQAAEVAKTGDLGYTWGTFEVTKTEVDGTVKVSQGKYVNVWKRMPSGDWKVVLDTGNGSPLRKIGEP